MPNWNKKKIKGVARMKAVLISIQPKWCEKIASGEKTIEVRKTKPNLETPFKCYIYCTIGNGVKGDYLVPSGIQCGKVIGEFVCDRIDDYKYRLTTYEETLWKSRYISKEELAKTCLSIGEINDYLNGKNGYGLHISDLKIYDKPKELSEFKHDMILHTRFNGYKEPITRPPQSWCYVEELQNG
jgi:predicted transcriptional regulator